MEKQISDITTSTAKKSDLDGTIIHLLHLRPKMIEDVAKELGVTLQWPELKAEPEADAETAPEAEVGAASGSLSDVVYRVSSAVYERKEQLRTSIVMLDWPAKQALARKLASVKPEWVEFVEKEISDINASTTDDSKKSNLDTILHLLVFRPSMIEVVAKELGVTLREPKDDGK